jgi:hypothetical protein
VCVECEQSVEIIYLMPVWGGYIAGIGCIGLVVSDVGAQIV